MGVIVWLCPLFLETSMEEKRYIVYKHTSPSNKIYIGITSRTLEERSGSRGWQYKKNKNTLFSNAIIKYGWDNFTHEVLLTNLTKEEATKMEQYFIALYKSNNSRFGYNLTTGGESGFQINDEAKEKISQKAKKQWQNPVIRANMVERLKISHQGVFTEKQRLSAIKRRGRKLPPEQIKKMSERMKEWRKTHNVVMSEEAKKQLSLRMLGKEPPNKGTHLTDEQKKIVSIRTREGMNNPVVKAKLRETQKKQFGKRFKYYVAQYDKNGKLLKIHKGVANASRELKIEPMSIHNCLKNKNKTGGGFIWKIVTREEYESENYANKTF